MSSNHLSDLLKHRGVWELVAIPGKELQISGSGHNLESLSLKAACVPKTNIPEIFVEFHHSHHSSELLLLLLFFSGNMLC